MDFDLLPDEQVRLIALELSLHEITRLCQSNTRFNRLICEDNLFWYLKYIRDIGPAPIASVSWKEKYMKYGTVVVYGLNEAPTTFHMNARMVNASPDIVIDINNDVFLLFTQLHQLIYRVDPDIIPGMITKLDFKAKYVSGSESHVLFIDMEDDLYGMGFNSNGELGTGDTEAIDFPTRLPFFNKVKSVVAGYGYSLVIDQDNNVWNFGYYDPELEDNEEDIPDELLVPILIPELKAQAAAIGSTIYSAIIDLENNIWVFNQKIDDPAPLMIPNVKAKAIACTDNYVIWIDPEDNVWYTEEYAAGINNVLIPNIKAKSISSRDNMLAITDWDGNVWIHNFMEGSDLPDGIIPDLKARSFVAGRIHHLAITDV